MQALEVSGLSLDKLARDGLEPRAAMQSLADWLAGLAETDGSVVFVGLNAPFDWSFVNYYFHRYLGSNPFGFAALDVKALFMGAVGCSWYDTRSSRMKEWLGIDLELSHQALDDSIKQAEMFEAVLALARRRPEQP